MALTPELAALLREIQEVRSPIGRMKILSRAWRQLRALAPVERRRIALQLGLGQFDPILERLGRKKDGILPGEVIRALEGIDDLDPSKVGQLVRDLRDPRRRKDLARRGLDLIRGRLDEEEPPLPSRAEPGGAREKAPSPGPEPSHLSAPSGPASSDAAPTPAPPHAVAVERQADPPGATAAPPSGARAEQSPLPRPSPDARPALPVPLPAPATVRAPERECPAPPRSQAPATEGRRGAPRPDAAAAATGPHPVPTPEGTPREPPGAAALTMQIAAEPSLMNRFALLRRSLAAGRRMDLPEIRDLITSFPEGWARRRVLIALIEQGTPGELDDALSLIEGLQRPADRRWCAAVLLASRTLSVRETDRLQKRIPLPSLRRRGRHPDTTRSEGRFAH